MSYIAKKYQSPTIIPPEAISQNWISKDCFDLTKTFSISFKFNNTTSIANKEGVFGIFLVDSEDTKVFSGSTVASTVMEYATKGMVGDCFTKNSTSKFTVRDSNGNTCDFLADHVYPLDENILLRNNVPYNAEGYENPYIMSVIFSLRADVFTTVKDVDGNAYFPGVTTLDYNTGELVTGDILTGINDIDYNIESIAYIQVLKKYYALKLPFNPFNCRNYMIRITFENNGKNIKFDVLKPYTSNYVNVGNRSHSELDISRYNNIRLGYFLESPILTYDKNYVIDSFNLVDFHISGKIQKQ